MEFVVLKSIYSLTCLLVVLSSSVTAEFNLRDPLVFRHLHRQPLGCTDDAENCASASNTLPIPECDDSSNCYDPCECSQACCHYVSLFGGWNKPLAYNGEVPNFVREGEYKDGFLIGGALGRCLTSRVRGEIELAYRYNQGDDWTVRFGNFAPTAQDWNGHLNVYTSMSNLIYDFGSCDNRKLKPYGGAGLGIAFLQGSFNTGFGTTDIDDTAFAYQAFGGVAIALKRNVHFFSEYRFLGTDNVTVSNGSGIAFGNDPYEAHSVLTGIRFSR